MRWVLVFVALFTSAAIACGDDEGIHGSPTTTSTNVGASPTPTTSPTASLAGDHSLIFLRPSKGYPYHGPIWEANIDGSNLRRLTPDGADAKYAGIVQAASGPVMYYVDWYGETKRSLWSVDVTTLVATHILDFESAHPEVGDAAVTPDGKHLAFSDDNGSVVMLDLQTMEQRIALMGNHSACLQGAGGCYSYLVRSWSPDGRTLLLSKRYWEGGDAMAIDPFADPATINLNPGDDFHPDSAEWSIDGSRVCGWGLYAEPSGLYMASAPDWTFSNLTPEYEHTQGTPPLVEHWVGDCAWIDDSRIAFAIDEVHQPAFASYTHVAQLSVYDLGDKVVAPVYTASATTGTLDVGLVPFGDGQHVVLEYAVGPDSSSMQVVNEVVDVTTGDHHRVLQPGDQVVAVE